MNLLALTAAAILALVVILATVLAVLPGHGSSRSSAGGTVPISGTLAVVGAVQTDIAAGTQIVIVDPAGQPIGSASLAFESQDPAENEVAYTQNATVPAEAQYGVEIPGTAPIWYTTQQAQAGIVDCAGLGCTP